MTEPLKTEKPFTLRNIKGTHIKKDRKFQSITFYQTKIIIFLTLILGLFSSLFIAISDYNRLNEEFEHSVRQILNSTENSAANAVYTYNEQLANEIGNGLFKFEPIIAVTIEDETTVKLTDLNKPISSLAPYSFGAQVLQKILLLKDRHITKKLYYKDRDDQLQEIGFLTVIVTPQQTLEQFLDRLVNLFISTLAFITILTITLIILLQKILADPLIKLEKTFSSFDDKHPDHNKLPDPDEYPNNEFRSVVISGRNMLETINKNVSELRRSHTELEDRVAERTANLQKLTQAIEQSPTMMFIVNSKTEIEYANTHFYEFTGFTKDEIIGQNPSILASGNTPALVYEDLWKTIKTGRVWKHQIEDHKKDGTIYWASITIAPIKDNNENITHYLCAQEDITDRVIAHQNLTKARDEAEKANRSKSEFLSNMSHELRTPLNAILGFAQLLEVNKKTPLNEKQRGQVDQILKGGNHLLELINEVLELSKIEAGKLGLSIEAVDAEELVEDCISFASTIAEKRGIIIKDCTTLPKPVLKVDRLRTKQIIMNLLSNSIKYNRDMGSVWIYGETVGDDCFRLSIVDTGYGIPEDKQSELFQPFSRLGAEGSAIEGTGIGLALSKKLIEAMDGKIGFSSLQDKSSTFWCEFPISNEDICENPCSVSDQDILALEENKNEQLVLYVEDNPANLTLFEEVINELSNVKMIAAHTAELGIELAEKEQPNVIILDINLPGMDGIEAVKKLKANERTRSIPVIALSANAMKKTIKEAIEAGFDDYLTKPIKIHKLFQILESVLR